MQRRVLFIAIFPIPPEIQVYQLSNKDTGIQDYLMQLRVARDRSQHVCLFCNPRSNIMFPLFFQSKTAAIQFQSAVIAYQLYHYYLPQFEKIKQRKHLNIRMNTNLLQNLGLCYTLEQFIINPDLLSIYQMEELELKIIRETIERFINRNIKKNQGNSTITKQNINLQFILRLRYKIVDTSLEYLPNIVSQTIMKKNVKQFDVSGCGLNDKILNSMLAQSNKLNASLNGQIGSASEYFYQNLVKLDLSSNNLTDLCFISLSGLVTYTPYLSDIILNNNNIKLLSTSAFKRQDKQENGRISRMSFTLTAMRLSTGFNPTPPSKQPLFIQFLLALEYIPLNFLNLDSNLIQEPEVLVEYIIEGSNVPLKYLSIKNNKFSEIDKIRMAKLFISEIRQRGETDKFPIIDFGQICVVDEQVNMYALLLRQKASELEEEEEVHYKSLQRKRQGSKSTRKISGVTIQDLQKVEANIPSVLKVSITMNKQWEMCDQSDMLQSKNLYKRNKVSRLSQIVNSLMAPSSLPLTKSQPNLPLQTTQLQPITPQTLKPTVQLLKQAYAAENYTAIQAYKKLLIDYNPELYNKKISPLFHNNEKLLKQQKQMILNNLDELINLQISMGNEQKLNEKLDMIISKFFRKRIDYTMDKPMTLYQGDDEQEIVQGHLCNVFAFLLYLKHRQEYYIEKLIRQKYDPMDQIYSKLVSSRNIYSDYYLSHSDWVCEDDYEQKLNAILTRQGFNEAQAELGEKKPPKMTQKLLNELQKERYLRICYINSDNHQHNTYKPIQKDAQSLCSLQPKLLSTGYLIKYYSQNENDRTMLANIECQLLSPSPQLSQPVNINIQNILDFTSRHDLLRGQNMLINPRIPIESIPTYQGIKLSQYPQQFENTLSKFSQLVVAFVKFLHHSPQRFLPESLQYLNYLINIILSEQNKTHAECLANEFYLQLLTYNAKENPQARAAQVSSTIINTLIQFCSLYMKHSENVQPFIIAHVIRAEAAYNSYSSYISHCRMIRHSNGRYIKKQDQLPGELIAYIFDNMHKRDRNSVGSVLVPVQVYYHKSTLNTSGQQEKMSKLQMYLNILTSIPLLLDIISASNITDPYQIPYKSKTTCQKIHMNKNWSLFICQTQSNKPVLLLPSATQVTNLYSIYRKGILAISNSKYYLLVKELICPIYQTMLTNYHKDKLQSVYYQIYNGFKQHGAILSLIDENAHVVNVIVQCMLCQVFLDYRSKILQFVDRSKQYQLNQISEICELYVQKVEQFSPHGTVTILSSQDKLYISSQINKTLFDTATKINNISDQNIEQKYNRVLGEAIQSFYLSCQLITSYLILTDPITNQQLLMTNHGVVRINRVIYAEAVNWRHVYDIKVISHFKENNRRSIKQVELLARSPQKGNHKLIIEGSENKNSAIFINTFLAIIKNMAIQFIHTPNSDLYRHFSQCINVEENKNKFETNEMSIKKNKLSLWNEIQSKIKYTIFEVKQTRKNSQEQIKRGEINASQNSFTNTTFVNVQIPQVKIQVNLPESKEETQIKKEVRNEVQININTIVENVIKQEAEDQKQEKKKSGEHQQIIVTNSRRSSRRELPRRRSSRDK